MKPKFKIKRVFFISLLVMILVQKVEAFGRLMEQAQAQGEYTQPNLEALSNLFMAKIGLL